MLKLDIFPVSYDKRSVIKIHENVNVNFEIDIA